MVDTITITMFELYVNYYYYHVICLLLCEIMETDRSASPAEVVVEVQHEGELRPPARSDSNSNNQ